MNKSVAVIGTRGYPSYYGGFETAIRKLAPYLCDQGWDVTVYGRSGAIAEDDADRDPRVRSVKTAGIDTKQFSTLSFGLSASLAVIRQKPDVALVMNVANGFWLPLLKMAGIPTVVNVDGIEWERAKWGRAARTMFKIGAWFTSKFATLLIADAVEIRRRWQEMTGRSLEFIPYGGDEPGDLPAPEGVTPGNYALLVARFVPENTINEFLDAATIIARTHEVVLVGSAGYADPIEARAVDLVKTDENISWLGHVSDDNYLHGLWENAGVYFHGHSVGGTNPALVQAMACSSPTVARDTVYNREVLADAAVFVEPQADKIAQACLNVLNDKDLRSELGRKALARSRSEYSWDGVCAAYEALLSDVSSASRPVSRLGIPFRRSHRSG